jgi:hypothetical protein
MTSRAGQRTLDQGVTSQISPKFSDGLVGVPEIIAGEVLVNIESDA